MFDIVVGGGTLVSPQGMLEADVCIKEGRVGAVCRRGELAPDSAKTWIDARGLLVFPGAIDAHVHFNDPGFTWREDFAHGTAAAAVGGVTTVIDMPLQNEPALTSPEIMQAKLAAVGPKAHVDFALWGGLLQSNFDELDGLRHGGCVGFKAFLGPVGPDYGNLTIGQAREALELLKKLDARAGFHCEDYSIIQWEEQRARLHNKNAPGEAGDWKAYLRSRPVVAELVATRNVLELARETGAKVHICHVSHPAVAECVREARKQGVDVTAETCGHYLAFSEENLLGGGGLFKCAPPLRSREDVEALWAYVEDGTLSCVCSDHSPADRGEKDEGVHGVFGAWGGISGVQNTVQVLYSEGVARRGNSPTLLARALSEGPARAFGLYGRKGALLPGFDADLFLLDPAARWEITGESLRYKNPISAFVGMSGRGLPVMTMVRGKIAAENGNCSAPEGMGRFLPG